MNLKLVLIFVIASLVVIFITQNAAVVDVRFLFWNVSMSRALLIFFLLILGIALGWLLHSYLSYRKSKDEPGGDV
jgi:putative membrane protein